MSPIVCEGFWGGDGGGRFECVLGYRGSATCMSGVPCMCSVQQANSVCFVRPSGLAPLFNLTPPSPHFPGLAHTHSQGPLVEELGDTLQQLRVEAAEGWHQQQQVRAAATAGGQRGGGCFWAQSGGGGGLVLVADLVLSALRSCQLSAVSLDTQIQHRR